jgi:ABC-type multidrug transport system ATPase subunit
MKTCSACQSPNSAENKFCQHCGTPFLDAQPAAGEHVTVRWTGQAVGRPDLRREASVATLFGDKDRLVIGRAPDCDICLPHPMVSRYHALVERVPEGLRLRDLASVNGVSLGGVRITEPVLIQEGVRVGVGPFLFSVRGGVVHTLDSSRSLRLEARDLERVVAAGRGRTRKLLDGVSLVVNPGEFVSLLGPSGSGKSTLMDCLNGRRRATGGRVLANGEDFYRHFANFRTSLGYVPQKDIVHTGLTVARALNYTARLRLPADTDPAELQARVAAVVAEMELGPHRDTLVSDLSGGQIKRVSLGAELLPQPCLLYIDEATSGLDAGTEARMMRLFRELADEGRSIVCITHNVDNVDRCHLALVLARGKLVYFGPPTEASRWFGVARISDIYDRLQEKDPGDWEKEFAASSLYREFIADRLAATALSTSSLTPAQPPPGPAGVRLANLLADGKKLVLPSNWPPLADRVRSFTASKLRVRELLAPFRDAWHQFRVLTARYAELQLGDRRSLLLLLLQAPLVAAFLLVGFIGKDYRSMVPFPRPLNDVERRSLVALQGIDDLMTGDRQPGAEADAALKKVRFEVEMAGLPATMDATRLVQLLRRMREPPDIAAAHRLIDEARFSFDTGAERVTMTGGELEQTLKRLRDARIPARLLAFDGPVVPDREGINPRYTYMLLFILVMIVLWFGCNNAAKEIVKEEAIYSRERAVNLGILPYLASKFVVLAIVTGLHAFLLACLVLGVLDLLPFVFDGYTSPHPDHLLPFLPLLGVFVLLAMAGVSLGLLLSACVSTPDRANALLPYVLIPQMILGGGFLAVNEGALYWLAVTLSPVYWSYRAAHCGAAALPAGFPGSVEYPEGALLPCEALMVQTAVLLLLTSWFLRRKEA